MSLHESKSDLKKKAIKGGAITVSAQIATILIQLISIVAMSRLLPPEDFGIIAMITAITAFMGLFRDMGLSTASIQKGLLSHEQTNMLFWLNVVAGTILMLMVMALSPVIAWFYKKQELTAVTLLLSTTFLFSSLGAQHAALMKRELRFKPLAIADVSGAMVNLGLSIAFALCGWRYWSLALGTVAGTFITSVLYLMFSQFKPTLPRKASGIRQLLGFGAHVTGFETVNYFSRNFDNILIGRVWGAVALGFYSRAYQMMMLPIVSLRTPINTVAFPLLSKLQSQPDEFRRYYRQINSLLAFLSMPLMAFLTTNAEPVVQVALGKQWTGIVPIFIYLGLAGFIQPVAGLRGLVMLSLGKSRRYLIWGIVNAIVMCLSFCIGIAWGGAGVACAYAGANYLILYPSLIFIFAGTPLKPGDFFNSISLPALASLLAAIGSLSAMRWLPAMQPIPHLVSSLAIFCTLFAFFHTITRPGRETIKSYMNFARIVTQ